MRLPVHKKILLVAGTATALLTAACGGGAGADTAAGAGTQTTAGGTYTAGTYSAEGSYTSPAGQETVGVQVTLDAEGTISAVTVTPQATDAQSTRFQTLFASGVAGEVVGKSIDEVSVDKVAGSSLTGGGFNAALQEIRDDAAA